MTRATLLSAPFQDRNGNWRAGATIDGRPVGITCKPEHSELRKGDIITVRLVGGEWRAA